MTEEGLVVLSTTGKDPEDSGSPGAGWELGWRSATSLPWPGERESFRPPATPAVVRRRAEWGELWPHVQGR